MIVLWTLLGYAVLSALMAAAVAWVNGVPWRQVVHTRAEDLSPRARHVAFQSLDGLQLHGFFAPPLGDRPVVLIQAGKRATRDHMLPWARVFARAGYGVFTFDWRAQGESEGWILSYGVHGAADLLGALEAVEQQPEAQGRPVGIYACSLGGACVAMAGDRLPPRVRCLVLDSPYGDLDRMAHQRLRLLGPLRWVPYWTLQLLARTLLGCTTRAVRPERVLEGFAPRPLLVMHGDQDTVVPYSEGQSLFERYPGPKEFWTDRGLDHVDARILDSRGFMARVAGFFARHLEGSPSQAEVLALTPQRLEEPTCWEEFRATVQAMEAELLGEASLELEPIPVPIPLPLARHEDRD